MSIARHWIIRHREPVWDVRSLQPGSTVRFDPALRTAAELLSERSLQVVTVAPLTGGQEAISPLSPGVED